jgi:chromate transporter
MSKPAEPEPAAPNPGQAERARPSLAELFIAFVAVALSGFGGALPWARRMIVERKRWMTAEEFNDDFALSQFLPGPNVVNFSVVFGSRFGGWAGAVVAFAGLMGPPLVIVTVLGVLYAQFGDLAVLSRILTGITAAAAGLILATTVKMAIPLVKQPQVWPKAVALVAFAAIGLIRWPLPVVLIALMPVAILLAWFWPASRIQPK